MRLKIQNYALVFLIGLFLLLFPISSYASIVINEIMPNPAGDDKEAEWVELYNTDRNQISIDGYILKDKNDNYLTLSGNLVDWLVVYPKDFPKKGNFSLTNSGSTIKLFTASTSAEPIDTFVYSDSDDNESWGKVPDGGGSIQPVTASKGSANAAATPSPSPTNKPTSTPKPTTTTKPTSLPSTKSAASPTVLSVTSSLTTPIKSTAQEVDEKEDGERTDSGSTQSAVLGQTAVNNNDSPEPAVSSTQATFPSSIFIILGGIGIMIGGIISLIVSSRT